MSLRLYNTLSGQLEELTPSDGNELRMYACGPTVYDYGHIGNFRTFLQVDVLRRLLHLEGIRVRHVMNITDVDDKIIRNAAAAGVSAAASPASASARGVGAIPSLVRTNRGSFSNSRSRLSCLLTAG